MRAVVKAKPGVGIDVMDMPEPKTIKPTEALVQIKACGICGSDVGLYEWREGDRYRRGRLIPLPVIIGHEPAGVVVKVGSEVKNLKPGDHVASDSWAGCGYCYWCRSGYFNLCSEVQNIGSLTPGAMASRCAIPFFSLYKIPESMSFEEGAMAQPLGVAVRGFEILVNFRPGDDVAVLGCGPIALMEALVARTAGAARIFVTGLSIDEKRLELARQLGFTTINAEEQSVRDVIMDVTGGLGVDVVFDATSTGIPGEAIKLVKPTGQLVITAVVEKPVTFDAREIRRGEIIIRHNRGRNPSTVHRAVNLIASGRVDVKPLITHRFKIEEAEAAFQTLIRREGMKVLILP